MTGDSGRTDVSGTASPDLAAVRNAVARIRDAIDFDGAQSALNDIALLLDMPVLSWAPDVSRPAFDGWMDRFMRRQGWSDEVMELWWGRNVMLKSPLYIRCRTRNIPFVTDIDARPPPGQPELSPEARAITGMMQQINLHSMITVPIHLPKGQVAMITFAGQRPVAEAQARLAATEPELMAAGQYFMRVHARVVGDAGDSTESRSKLTPREWECLRLTAQGHRESQVAELLDIRPSTVRYHLRNAETKLGAATRTHAVALAAQLGLLGPISS